MVIELKNKPQALRQYDDRRQRSKDVWYYEDEFGLTVVCGGNADTKLVVIPKKAILDYAKRVTEQESDDE